MDGGRNKETLSNRYGLKNRVLTYAKKRLESGENGVLTFFDFIIGDDGFGKKGHTVKVT